MNAAISPDVLRYSAVESLSQPRRYDVAVTCSSADIACDTLLLKPASFTFMTPVFDGTPALPVRTVYGVVQSFRRISTSNDDTRYAMTIVPRIALLDYTKGSEIYLNQSVTEVVEKILRKHGPKGLISSSGSPANIPPGNSSLSGGRPILSLSSACWRKWAFTGAMKWTAVSEQDVVIFQDSQQQYEFGVMLPLRNQSRDERQRAGEYLGYSDCI